jgi:hypothetical protein
MRLCGGKALPSKPHVFLEEPRRYLVVNKNAKVSHGVGMQAAYFEVVDSV